MIATTAAFGHRYLAEPTVFPGEGETFGAERLALEIAEQPIVLRGLAPSQKSILRELWHDFEVARESPLAIDVCLYRVADSRFRRFDCRGWSYALDFDYRSDGMRMAGLGFVARIERRQRLTGSVWTGGGDPGAARGVIENFLRILLAYALLERGGVLLHSAGTVDAHGARLFIGASGAGKSTVARQAMSSGRSVLSDDLNVVLPATGASGGFRCGGSPFLGDEGVRSRATYSLRGIYRLQKGTRDELRPVGGAEALASLAACAPFVNRDPYREGVLLAILSELARTLPAYVLTFRRDGTFWPLLRNEG